LRKPAKSVLPLTDQGYSNGKCTKSLFKFAQQRRTA
jgi:hypothetical protein